MGDLRVFGSAKVTLLKSFVEKMPESLNKVQYFEESFRDLKFTACQEGECASYCLEGLWETVIKAQHELRFNLEKWNISKNLEDTCENLLHSQGIFPTSLEIENISSKQQDTKDPLLIRETNVSNKEALAVTKPLKDTGLNLSVKHLPIKCSTHTEFSKVVEANGIDDECGPKAGGGGGTSLKSLEDQDGQKHHLCTHAAIVCSAEKKLSSIEDTDSSDFYYNQVTLVENEVYMDIQLEHNYNHLRSAESTGTGSGTDEPTIENEIYMDITLSKPNDEIFTNPDLPVTLVVAKEDEPEVLQLNVNKTTGLISPSTKSIGQRKISSDHQEHQKIRRKKYEEQAPFKYFCNQCSFKTKRHSHMRNHSRLHERICTIYSCDQCDFSTIRASHLQRHLGTHMTEVLACSECTYSTHSEALLSKHQKYKHIAKKPEEPRTKDNYQCLHCDYMTTSEKIFKRHLTVHLKKGRMKPPCFKCNHCPYQTPSRSNYYRHLGGTHGDERPFMCPACGLCFKRSDTLMQHQATHGDKESAGNAFQCLKCEKFYRSANALKEHQLTHEEERRYLCEICAASFKTRAVQRKHYLQKHVHAKVNQCPSCSKSFTSRYLLKRHMKVHNQSEHGTDDCKNQVNNITEELQPDSTDPIDWCDSIVPVQSSDVQVFVVHQDPSESGGVQGAPSLMAGSVIPVEYVISTGDSESDNCNDGATVNVVSAASHIQSSEGEIITLAFVHGD